MCHAWGCCHCSRFIKHRAWKYPAYRFSGIPNEIVHMLFGPVVGSVFAGTMDILKYLIKPTGAFFPGFTLIAMLAGLIYGSFYYKKELNFWRVLAAHITVALICNVLLNTWCLSILYGKAFAVLLPARLVKNAIMCPIDALFLSYCQSFRCNRCI